MQIITKDQLESILSYDSLIPALQQDFCSDISVPMRHHHDYQNPQEGKDSTLLLMPAWEAGQYLGVKIVTVSPNNSRYDLPSIQGIYLLMDAHKGLPLAQMEAKTLTTFRTAAASALASSYLSRRDSESLLMVGTGALAPRLIAAHAAVRPIKQVYIWGRNFEKASGLAKPFSTATYTVTAVKSIAETIPLVDIISVATLSETPLIFGESLHAGQHLDLVGAYKPNMREADDAVVRRCSIYVDTRAGAFKETGDIVIPIQKGIIKKNAILADLFDLCQENKLARQSDSEITLFKSVGHALEDLAAAKLVYEAIKNTR